MTTETIARRYRIPSIEPEVCEVGLDDFDVDEIREYLKRVDTGTLNGPAQAHINEAFSESALAIEPEDLNRIETLAVCGQLEYARAEALRLVSEHIGRPL